MFRGIVGGTFPGLYVRISLVSICAGSMSGSTSHPLCVTGTVRMIFFVEWLHDIDILNTLTASNSLFTASLRFGKFFVATKVAVFSNAY